MSVRLVLGRAGTGKTHYCLEAVRDAQRGAPFGPPLILLVPEQATFQMEQGLIAVGVEGSARARILSFKRLAHLIFQETGGALRPRLTDVGRTMLLRALVHRRRGALQLYHQVVREAGFIERLGRTFSEFRAHGYSPDDIERQATAAGGPPSPLLRKKLHDLSLLYRDYVEHIADKYADPDSDLGEAAEALLRSGLLRGAEIWIDGFAGFTPQEYRLLYALIQVAKRTHVSLCLDPDEFLRLQSAPEEEVERSLFRLPLETARELLAIAKQSGVPVEEPVVLRHGAERPSRFRHPALLHLEQNWEDASAPPYREAAECVRIERADDRTAEVESVATEIQRLVRLEGYRYQEISVIVRSLDTYAAHIAAVFTRMGIPYFIDSRRDMLFHPLVHALTAALEAVSTGWQSEPIMRFLKTDFTPLPRARVDLLENYVLEHGVTGRAWVDERPWSFGRKLWRDEDDDAASAPMDGDEWTIDEDRRLAVRPLQQLSERIGRGKRFTPREAAEALWNFLVETEAERRMAGWIEEARGRNDPELALLHAQVWSATVGLLDEMAAVLPEDPIDLAELTAMLDEAFRNLRLGLIPPKLDQVLVGAVDRSRQPDVRAVFVLGLVDREFPAVPQEDALLTDEERELLAASGLTLGDTSRSRMDVEQFYGYIALTRASERLYLSAPLSDGQGRALLPSAFLARAKRLLPRAREGRARRFGGFDLARIVTPQQAAAFVVTGLRLDPDNSTVLDAYEWLVTHPDYAPLVRPTLRSLVYSNAVAPLLPELAAALYGEPLVTSVSRLERFAACPFQHFARYGLRLEERAVLRLDPARIGTLTHAVLKAYVDWVREHGLDWETIRDEEAYAVVDRLTEAAARELVGEVLLSSGRQRYLVDLARRTVRTAVRLLNEQMRAGDFRPVATELAFGRPRDEVAGWQLPIAGGGAVQLVGVIDRLDTWRHDGTTYVRVVDYKGYERGVALADVLAGLELQLIVYLGVAADHLGAAPAGAFYQPVRDPFVPVDSDFDPDAAWALRKTKLKARGILSSDGEGEVALAMDRSVVPSSTSSLFPFGLNKDGSFRARSSVVSGAYLELLIDYVRDCASELAGRILRGEHDVRPFRRKDNTRACNRCPYHAVCRFDVLVEGNEYRYIDPLDDKEVWSRLRGDATAVPAS